MVNRAKLIDLRPNIPSIHQENATNKAERFQNEVLRPILKLQHALLVVLFEKYCEKRKGVYLTLSSAKKMLYVENSLRKDLKFKALLQGVIIGHFTIAEYALYQSVEKELAKRLTNLLIQRLQSEI